MPTQLETTQLETTRRTETLARLKAPAGPCPSSRGAPQGRDAPQSHDEGPTEKELQRRDCRRGAAAIEELHRGEEGGAPRLAFRHQHSVISAPLFGATIMRCNHHAVLSKRMLTQLMLTRRTVRQLMFKRLARGATSHRLAGRCRAAQTRGRDSPRSMAETHGGFRVPPVSLKQHPCSNIPAVCISVA
jgi:hypothetical protein